METTKRRPKVGDVVTLKSRYKPQPFEVKVEEVHRDPSGFVYIKYRTDNGTMAWEQAKNIV